LLATSVAAKEEQFGSDAWITAKTKIALITTDGVSAMDVNVDTVDGKVTLHGKVDTQQAKDKAATVTKKIEGVRDVRNLLQVIEAGRHEETEVDDKAIAKNVEDAIEADKSLDDSEIRVQSVNNGVVLLAGHATSLGDHLEALTVAGGVPGVRRVASEVTSDNRLYDDSIWHQGAMDQKADDAANAVDDAGDEIADAARAAGEKISDAGKAVGRASSEAASATGNAFKDAWITAATKTKLVADDAVSAMDVNVDTQDGVVTLFGTVESMQAKAAAEQDARSVSGVRDVKNEIEIAMNEKRDTK
jgi:osmotically-inducible protein OsmY